MDAVFIECFGELEDPRVDRTKKHLLLDIIALALCGVIAGATDWEEIEDFGELHKDWFSQFLELPHGIPSHDTISRVFAALEPKAIQECSINWLKRIRDLIPETIIPIDGKTLRRSGCKSKCQKALHVINAWSCANGISLGQLKYVIALKGNQGSLHELVKESFDMLDQGATTLLPTTAKDEIDAEHGRIDQREIEVISTDKLANLIDPRWKNLNSIIRVIHASETQGNVVTEKRFYISSLPVEKPLEILHTIRSHWQIESCLHWSLDVTFREDNCRIRNENAALSMSWLRKINRFGTSIKMELLIFHTP
ncbi:MAG: hypothetical protein A2X77_03980 [Gammaproteobacteria bacterium GWE2_42_36]|nr:MAG: hypothetical protein A2X77_03980 [Gammaproteobacteria bacterium GWE2_42_36]HCU04996.1 hypothetical protein [Coxiellaceae bacterium]